MAIDLLLDKQTHDLIIENGDLKLTTSKPQLLKQRMTITFKTFVGEWFKDKFFGGINKEIIFKKPSEKAKVDSWFITVINSFEEVEQIVRFESTLDTTTRAYDLSFTVRTNEGNTTLFVKAGVNSITYPFTPTSELGAECDIPTPADANEFYILIHEDIPVNIPWVTGQQNATNGLLTESGDYLLDEAGNYLETES